LPGPQVTAYPALTAADKTCAEYWGGATAAILPAGTNYLTPSTLGILCNLPPSKQTNELYLSTLFIKFVDFHRFVSSGKCPSDYDVIYNGALARPVDCAY
jgi:hypothetical protein